MLLNVFNIVQYCEVIISDFSSCRMGWGDRGRGGGLTSIGHRNERGKERGLTSIGHLSERVWGSIGDLLERE